MSTIVPVNLLYANNNGPKAPEAASFEPIDATDMVNLVTGDFSYVLPLINIPGPEGGYPISLSYHAGIAMDQESSWVGLGWNLNPGALNRNVSGVPDDWNDVKKYTTVYDKGGAVTNYSIGVSVGFKGATNVGTYASYTENKTFGGENSYDFSFGISGGIGISKSFGISGSIGTGGASIGGKYGSIGTSVSQSFKNSSTSIGFTASGSVTTYESTNINGGVSGSMGVSLNTKKGMSLTSSIGSASLSGGITNPNLSFKNDTFPVIIPFVDFSYSRQRWWLFDTDYTEFNGSLYAGNMRETIDGNLFDKVAFDGYESLYSINNSNNLDRTNFSNISYDKYSISGQGISGTIQPQILEEGTLSLKNDRLGGSYIASYAYPDSNQNGDFKKSIALNNFHFYFNNENSSYLKVNSNHWNTSSNGNVHFNIFDFNTTDQSFESIINIDGENFDGYNENNGRKKSGNFIETYTNGQIINELSGNNTIKFIEAKGLQRDASFPDFGIGGFKVTSTDGKTYHYSLPVYQKEKFARSAELDKDIRNHFFEESQLEPYATHWLLTAITGPDYVDINSDNNLDEGDYGYWVEFEYGKWSDGFSWRTPTDESIYEKNINSKRYEWGVKEIYYLDKIKTKTHTALFVKETREDNQSSIIDISDNNDYVNYEDVQIKSFTEGKDGNWYIDGMYDNWQPSLNSPISNFHAETDHRYYFKTFKHKSLKLNKIILLKNNDVNTNISKSNSNQENSIIASNLKIKENYEVWFQSGQLYSQFEKNIHDKTWRGQFYDKVLDVQDIIENASEIHKKAIEIIDFDHDYSLMPNSSNSDGGANKSKLTLKKVNFRGKKNSGLIPPYTFEYNLPSTPYNNEMKDDWGYNVDATSWNLNSIKTPTGQILQIDYEEDDYYKEAAKTNFVFDDRLELRFYNNAGLKKLRIRNHPDNLTEQIINFNDYFVTGEPAEIDVLVWENPDHNGSHRIADISKACQVSQVSSNLVEFILPSSSQNSDVRRDENCNKKNWVKYQHYSQVSNGGITGFGWMNKVNAENCDGPGNGNRRVRYYFYSNKTKLNNIGGGVRVKNLTLTDDTNRQFTSNYNYKNPGTNISSGITSYAPSRKIKEVKYINELPGPSVMYKYVTVSKKDSDGEVFSKDLYEFDVLSEMELDTNGFHLGDFLNLSESQNISYNDLSIDNRNSNLELSKFKLTNNLSALGRLKSKTTFNSNNQIITRTINSYKENNEIKQGITQETFKTYKKISRGQFNDLDYHLSSSSNIIYPNVLKSVKTITSGYTNSREFSKYDFYTGEILETETLSNKGENFKTKVISAYQKYPQMGSKVDNVNNKNMLTQEAVNYIFINKKGTWEPVDVGVTTWSNDWTYKNLDGTTETPVIENEKIWRKHKSFVWDGEINEDGTYTNYNYSITDDDGFDWTNPFAVQPSHWKQINETILYDHYSMTLELKDINNNYASTKMWDNDTKVVSTSNAKYTEHFTSDSENIQLYENLEYIGNGVLLNTSVQTDEKSHTGKFAVKIDNAKSAYRTVLKTNEHRAGVYRLSVWAHKDNYQSARVKLNKNQSESFNAEIISVGNWVQLNHEFYLDSNQQIISITAEEGIVFLDDYRLYPIASAVKTYVYNEYDELEATLGSNNIATKYQYDNAGRLIRVFQEVADTPTILGGFKRASEYQYNYARELSNNSNEELIYEYVYFDNIIENHDDGAGASTGVLKGPPGALITFNYICNSGSESNASATVNINGITLSLIGGESATISEVIPENGQFNVSIQHNNSNFEGNSELKIITSSDPGVLSNPLKIRDENQKPR
ncbi:hypothetical protein [Tenacibaculum sp. 190524A05c]